MLGNVETKKTDNLNRDELFRVFKDKCKSILRCDLYGNIVVLILVILLLIFTWQRLENPKDISDFMFWIAFVIWWGWLLLFDFRFLKKVDSFDTPDRLLYCFEKKHRNRMIAWLLACIFSFLHLIYFI